MYCRRVGPSAGLGTCAEQRGVGSRCEEDAQCWNDAQIAQYVENSRSCNHDRYVAERPLVKTIGEDYDRDFDKCDDRRALQCLWSAVEKKMVYQ